MMTDPAEIELREIERRNAIEEIRASGKLCGRAWFDPDAGKPMPKLDLLPPNLCGFWNAK